MSERHDYDYIIIGAGPSGLQLGYFLERSGYSYLILERGSGPGTFFKRYPRHGTMISNNKVYTGFTDSEVNLRFDWNSLLSDDDELRLGNYSQEYFPQATDFVRYLEDFAEKLDLNIERDSEVMRISKRDGFDVHTANGKTYHCKYLIAATGISKPNVPRVPNAELAETYDQISVDPADYTNQRVLIVGKGNSALETADSMIANAALIHVASPEPVKLAWNTHFVGHLRAVNNNFLDTYQLKSQNALLDATITNIEREGDKYHVTFEYSHAEGEIETLVYDRVLFCTGFRFDSDIFDEECRPDLMINDRFPTQTSEWESTNVPGLYFAGALTQSRDFKVSTSGFIHGFRYNARCLFDILRHKNHDEPLRRKAISNDADALTDMVIARINKSSAMWQQFGFIGDAIAISDEERAWYYDELPVDYVNEGRLGKDYYTITLEYGAELHNERDVFAVQRSNASKANGAERSRFLHPVIRFFSEGELLSEHHVMEHLEANWTKQNHVEPLREYFTKQMQQLTTA